MNQISLHSNAASSADTIATMIEAIGSQAKQAYRHLAIASADVKKEALLKASDALNAQLSTILAANEKDMAFARKKGISGAMLDRLLLNEDRVASMASGLRAIAAFDDPVGKTLEHSQQPNGLDITKVTVPLGVIGIIYESRPNVTADAAALCIKSGNAAILRGGSESLHSSQAIVACMHTGLKAAGLPIDAVQLVPTRDREAVGHMLQLTDYIDVIVPRGGKSLTQRISEQSRIPTIQHLDGNCHCYVHASADIAKAVKIIHNAKLRRTGICGATESLVIDEPILADALPQILDRLDGVEVFGDEAACAVDARVKPASADDWGKEYLDTMISVKTVASLDDAIIHVNRYSSYHTDCIIAEDEHAVARYQHEVDSAIVMHNTSTQFADGGEFGMGAEIGISTGRLHARGPVGCSQLTTYKYVVTSDGAVRA